MSLLAAHRGQDPQTPVRNFGTVDRSFVARRLRQNLITLINAHSKAELLGPDELVENIALTRGFTDIDLVILRVQLGGRRHTLVGVPERAWARKGDLLDLKRQASWSGRSCVLIPAGAVQREPRLTTARLIERAAGIDVTMDHRAAILMHLIEAGTSTLLDCAAAIDHPTPFGAVLHLVATGVLRLQEGPPLCPGTRVHLNDPTAG